MEHPCAPGHWGQCPCGDHWVLLARFCDSKHCYFLITSLRLTNKMNCICIFSWAKANQRLKTGAISESRDSRYDDCWGPRLMHFASSKHSTSLWQRAHQKIELWSQPASNFFEAQRLRFFESVQNAMCSLRQRIYRCINSFHSGNLSVAFTVLDDGATQRPPHTKEETFQK